MPLATNDMLTDDDDGGGGVLAAPLPINEMLADSGGGRDRLADPLASKEPDGDDVTSAALRVADTGRDAEAGLLAERVADEGRVADELTAPDGSRVEETGRLGLLEREMLTLGFGVRTIDRELEPAGLVGETVKDAAAAGDAERLREKVGDSPAFCAAAAAL